MDVAHVEPLLAESPVVLVATGDTRGRGLAAARAIRAGELVLISQPACMSVHRKHAPFICASCAAFSEDGLLSERCEACECTHYCSAKCRAADAPLHEPHCDALRKLNADRKLKKEETSFVRLLLRLLSRCASGAASLDSVTSLMSDHAGVKGYKRRKRQRAAAARAFVKLLPRKGDAEPSALARQLEICPKFRKARNVEALLDRGPLNEFGLCELDGEAAGCGWYPSAAMVNSSCVPSTAVQLEGAALHFYALRELRAGEEITFCYCTLAGGGELTRRANLVESWGIDCECERCCYEEDPDMCASSSRARIDAFDRAHVCVGCGNVAVPPERRPAALLERGAGACCCGTFNALRDRV